MRNEPVSNLAKRILVASEEFSAEDMLEIGFLDHLVLPAQLEEMTDQRECHRSALLRGKHLYTTDHRYPRHTVSASIRDR